MRACYTKQNISPACPNFNAFVFSEITQKLFHICLSLWKNNHWHSIIQLPVVWNHYWLSVQSSYSNIKTTSGLYFDKWMILKFDLRSVCLGNVSLGVFEFWALIQPVCELRAVSPNAYLEPSRISMELFAKIVNVWRRKLFSL